MNKEILINLIREVVKDELKNSLPKLLSEIALNIANSNSKKPIVEQQSNHYKMPLPTKENKKPQQNQNPLVKKPQTSSKILNDIFKETSGFTLEERQGIPPPSINYDGELQGDTSSEAINNILNGKNVLDILKKSRQISSPNPNRTF